MYVQMSTEDFYFLKLQNDHFLIDSTLGSLMRYI